MLKNEIATVIKHIEITSDIIMQMTIKLSIRFLLSPWNTQIVTKVTSVWNHWQAGAFLLKILHILVFSHKHIDIIFYGLLVCLFDFDWQLGGVSSLSQVAVANSHSLIPLKTFLGGCSNSIAIALVIVFYLFLFFMD